MVTRNESFNCWALSTILFSVASYSNITSVDPNAPTVASMMDKGAWWISDDRVDAWRRSDEMISMLNEDVFAAMLL
jgi:hypothetical protein